ncbi:rab GTP-binding protein, putative [Bodo saltans]|uniref:Rab GTP-binding protein, putative n=1 Tax=Bodo saltans TaxID=75058 RepID=A0A0S4JBJ9_BODSA|nr:rab GTP-binding protein, putative [Bodo saltans]|eukprot:CUG88765.1 rab GTP-binding protein, putative [Bodo saltans]
MSQSGGAKKYKVVLLGESGVGKSSLVLRLVKDEWIESQHSTVGASFFRYACHLEEGTTVNYDIWDTAGQERYKSLASMYYRSAAAALVVYDITSADSFERAKYWVRELTTNSPETIITLVGNKCDLEHQRKVSFDDAKRYSQEMGLLHCESSAKEGTRVQTIFVEIARKLTATVNAATVRDGGVVGRDGQKKRDGSGKQSSGGCCK